MIDTPGPKIVFQIIISVDSIGRVHVTGPMEQKIAVLGALELAKSAVMNFDSNRALHIPNGVIGKDS